MTKTYVEEYVGNPEHMRLFQQERAIYEVTELLESAMKEIGVTRADLAKRLGKTRGWVTQLLDGDTNKTIRTVADAFAVLGCEFRSFYRQIEIGTKSTVSSMASQPISMIQANNVRPEDAIVKMHKAVNTSQTSQESVKVAVQ